MINNRHFAIAFLALLVLGTATCSSSSKESETTNAPTTTAPPVRVVGKIGPCPKIFPRVQLATLNKSIQTLDEKLVPFDAQNVRVCTYSLKGLTASGTLAPAAAAKFVADTNALPKAPGPLTCANQEVTRLFFLSFDDGTQRVHVGESDSCGGGASNGVFIANSNKTWADEVISLATKKEAAAATTTSPSASTVPATTTPAPSSSTTTL